jgi:hypothetical protein
MSDLFIVLYLLSLIAMVVAIVKRKTISKSLLAFAVALPTILFIGIGATLPPTVDKGKIVETTAKEIQAAVEEPKNENTNPLDEFKKNIESELDVNVYVSYSKSDCVNVTFPISDNLFKDSRIRGGQRDMIAILAEYKELVWDKNASACVTGTFPSVDQYGNINQKEPAMMITVDYKTLMKMNLGNMDNNPALLDNYDLYSYILFPYMRG